MASGDAIQQIKDRLNIIDVVSPYVELHQAGKHFKGRCPFHNEKSPSFHVSPERGTYHCFGCGVGGDIFSFVQAIDGVDFKEALKILAQKANIELVPERPEKRTQREQLVAIIEAATSFYEAELEKNTEALAYLDKRGVTKETIKKWRIGYAPGPPQGGWREVKGHLNTIGYSDEVILKAGLIKSADAGKEPFDVFRDRLMFPLRDSNGRVVAFSGRILHPDEKSPKYVNSPETELYHKSELLYGYDLAKHNLRQLPFWLIVEGQFDVVMSHQAGYTTAVAVSGTALTLHHVQLLERMSKNVVLALDADKAGIAAMKKGAELMLRRGLDVKVAKLPDGADPADMVLSDAKSFKTAIGHSVHVIEFLLIHLRQQVSDDRAYKLRVREEIVPFVTLIPNRIDQDHFEGIIATALGTNKEAVHFEVVRLLDIQKNNPVHREGLVSDVVIQKNEAGTSVKTLAYLVAAVNVVTPEERAVLKQLVIAIVGRPWSEACRLVPDGLSSQLTFSLETEFEKVSQKVRRAELVHKLNQLRELTLRDQMQVVRAQIGSSETGDGAILAEIAGLAKALQIPPLTTGVFDGG